MAQPRKRSNLPKDEARRRYVELAELVVLEQIRDDAARLDREALPVGPFARLDANAVAGRVGKTRGAISNLFGSQAALQAETMALALDAAELVDVGAHPAPEDFPAADAWVDAFFADQAARGPQHGAEPSITYASLWTLWLAAVPYGVWSERVARPSMDEHAQHLAALESLFARALEAFGVGLAEGVTLPDLAGAVANLVEGAWLNQCLSPDNPSEPRASAASALQRRGRMLWRGATRPP